MVTMNLDLIAQMTCNPAIGGIAKGHLVREIDAWAASWAKSPMRSGIQFRLLNTSRGSGGVVAAGADGQEAVPPPDARSARERNRICASSRRRWRR